MNFLKIIGLAATVSQFAHAADAATVLDYEEAFAGDRLWPSQVMPLEDVHDDAGRKLLTGKIPVVFIRAYEDGKLAVVDRSGTLLIDHEKTDFIQRVEEHREESEGWGEFSHFLSQIGRRVFDLDYDEKKAVPETELARFDSFLICRTSAAEEILKPLLERLDVLKPELEKRNIEVLLVFEELMPNAEFHELLVAGDVRYPVVVPVFSQGFVSAVFTPREAGYDFLWVTKDGKLIQKAKELAGIETLNPQPPSDR